MTKQTLENSISKRLAKLKDDYLKRLPEELFELEKMSDSLTEKPLNLETLKNIYQRLHKLTGSTGTFGLKELSIKTRKLEQQAKNWIFVEHTNITSKELKFFIGNIKILKSFKNEVESNSIALSIDEKYSSGKKIYQIWVVEDNSILGEELQRQLDSFDFSVRLFHHLKEVDDEIKNDQPDLILTKVIFEDSNENSTQIINSMSNILSSNCPIIYMSTYDDFDSRLRAAKMGAEGFFIKPLDIPRLINRIVQLFEKQKSSVHRVLIIEDDQHTAEHLKLVLAANGLESKILNDGNEIVQTVMTYQPELILMDLYMPDCNGTHLAGVLRQYDKWLNLPIVFLSSETDKSKQTEAMRYGADDFLTKPVSDNHLIATVKIRIERARNLNNQISLDSLTGLLKHSSIKDAANNEVERIKRTQKNLTLAMLDIDNFKSINDTYGHTVGDVVICSVAMLLRQRLRQYDIVGRYGGEEFAIVLSECDPKSAKQLMDDIRKRFSKIQFRHKDTSFNCYLSVGLACTENFPNASSSELFILADKALYKAKELGRNQVQVADDSSA